MGLARGGICIVPAQRACRETPFASASRNSNLKGMGAGFAPATRSPGGRRRQASGNRSDSHVGVGGTGSSRDAGRSDVAIAMDAQEHLPTGRDPDLSSSSGVGGDRGGHAQSIGLQLARRVKVQTVKAALDTDRYQSGIKVSDEELDAVKITRKAFHGEWNYSIRPSTPIK